MKPIKANFVDGSGKTTYPQPVSVVRDEELVAIVDDAHTDDVVYGRVCAVLLSMKPKHARRLARALLRAAK